MTDAKHTLNCETCDNTGELGHQPCPNCTGVAKTYQIFKDEWPLFDHLNLCPSARYVGAVSRFVCECTKPNDCAGVKAARAQIEEE